MAKHKPVASKAAPATPAETATPAADAPAAPKKGKAKRASAKAQALADTIGNPEDVDLQAENTLKIGKAPDARGKQQPKDDDEEPEPAE